MEANFWLVSLPALISLSLKGGIYAYAHFSRTHSYQTRLYLLTLFAFSIQNIAEIAHFHTFIKQGVIPNFEVNLYYASGIVAFGFLFHLVLTLVFDPDHRNARRCANAVYVYALTLLALLYFTPWLIQGYTPIGKYTVTRIPGPLYPLIETYAVGICVGALSILICGVGRQVSAYRRTRVEIILIAVAPLATVLVTVLVALHMGIRLFNAAVIMPIALVFFLAITAYATHRYRLFDIQYFIPWSKLRQRKTGFYARIRAMIAEIAELGSVKDVVNRLSQTLNCPVALIGGPKPVLAMAGEALAIARFPHDELHKIDRIVVANEIAESTPEVFALMQRHRVAAIVPFHPHSESAPSWMLLGDRFSEEVYSPLDFKMVEQLFDRMGEMFLDKLLPKRTQLADALREIRALHQRLALARDQLAEVRKENQVLRQQSAQLLSEYALTVQSSVLTPPAASGADAEPAVIEVKTLDDYVAEFETRIISQVLKRCEGSKAKAARLLGLRPNTLHYKIERYGLSGKNLSGKKDRG